MRGSKRDIRRRLLKQIRGFLGPGVGVHVSRSSYFSGGGMMEHGLGWNWRRLWMAQVYGGRAVSQGIEVQAVDHMDLAGDVLEMVIDCHPEWLKK